MLADKLFKLESFQKEYKALVILSVGDTIPLMEWYYSKDDLMKEIDWNYLLSIASILSFSPESEHLEAALRISQTCLMQDNCNQSQKLASTVILNNLTNKPALNLAIERNFIEQNYESNYPLALKLQKCKIDFENSILVKDKLITLNRFQKNVYEIQKENETISISAPTSAGKSYILCTLLLKEIINGTKNIVYIVPTRALISQVENDLRKLIQNYNLNHITNITTVPPQEQIDTNKSNIFVFTQERLHWFLISGFSIDLNLLIIDEAHKIEDSNRGILLQQKLEEVVKYNPNIKVYFSSPFTANPEILLQNVFNSSRKEKVNTQFISVNQNLIYVTQCPRKPKEWNLDFITSLSSYPLGKIILDDYPTNELKKVVYLSEKISDNNASSIIYCNGAAESEKTSKLLFDLLSSVNTSSQIYELVKLVKHVIHPNYLLATILTKGIAFHYGNMPLLIRQEIERLFIKGDIKYLICTSTLLEGVNLPAKSIFIRKPTRGKQNPLNSNDFWNLAGRAGRWGKEYSGNIICIEPKKWEIPPNPIKTKQIIKRAIDIVEQNGQDLLKYIDDNSPRDISNRRQDLEFAFGYYYNRFIIENTEVPNQDFYKELVKRLRIVENIINLPNYIIKRNPGISPIAQQKLFDYFSERGEKIEEYLPVYPDDENALNEYIKLVGRIGKTISDYPPQLNYVRALLLINWMSGKPLSYLIRKSYNYYHRNENCRQKPLPTVIREVMDNIETFVRFKFAKDSSCYIDILRYYLELNGKTSLSNEIPSLNLWLEFGVSQKTHLSLLSLGLSRNTVIELTQYIINTQMSKEESLNWIREQDLDQLELSPIIIEEIRKTIAL